MTLSTLSTSSRGTVLFVPVGRDRMVGNLAEMFARMKKVDRSFVGSELFEKRPVVGCGVGDGNQFEIGPHLADMSDLFGELRLQRCLAGFRHPSKTERFQAIAFRVLETDRPTGRLAPACFLVPVGAKRNHHPVERDGAGNGFAGFRLPDAVHGFLLRFLPETARRFQQARGSTTGSCLPALRRVWPLPAACNGSGPGERGMRPGSSVNQAHRRPARTSPFPSASGNTGPDRTACGWSSASVQPEPCHPREPGRPFRPGVFADHHPAQRNDPLTRPRNRRTRPSRLVPSLTKVANAPNALAVAAPLLDDGRKSSHRLGGHRGEFREGQTIRRLRHWHGNAPDVVGLSQHSAAWPGAFFFAPCQNPRPEQRFVTKSLISTLNRLSPNLNNY